jgi:hypothetical protein
LSSIYPTPGLGKDHSQATITSYFAFCKIEEKRVVILGINKGVLNKKDNRQYNFHQPRPSNTAKKELIKHKTLAVAPNTMGDFKVGFSVGVYCTKCTRLNTGVNTNFEITQCMTTQDVRVPRE